MINLDAYTGIKTSLFVKIEVEEYRTSAGASYAPEVLTFSDHNETIAIGSDLYIPLGNLLGVTSSQSDLRPTGNNVNITISGIPDSNLAEIIHSKIKGSRVTIYRAYYDISTNVQINSMQFRYKGVVNNYGLEEEYDVLAKEATNTILIECLSNVDVLANKVAGRRTNPDSMKKFYSTDKGFDNITSLKNRSFDFGVSR
jgi:hypothetical protein